MILQGLRTESPSFFRRLPWEADIHWLEIGIAPNRARHWVDCMIL